MILRGDGRHLWLCWLASFGLGCFPEIDVPTGAQVSCETDAECPGNLRCNVSTNLCVAADRSDLAAPIVQEVELSSPVAGHNNEGYDTIRLTLTVDEPLAGHNRVYFRDNGTERSFASLSLVSQTSDAWVYQTNYVPTGVETETTFGLLAVLEDAFGNRFEGALAVSLGFDFTYPSLVLAPAELAPGVVLLPDPIANPLAREVATLTHVANRTTRVLLTFTVTEDVATPNLFTATPTDLTFRLFGRAGNTWTYEVAWAETSDAFEGSYDVIAELTDAGGNTTEALLEGAPLLLDTVPPGRPAVDDSRTVVLVRAPWGEVGNSNPVFRLLGEPGAAEPFGWVLVYLDAEGLREVGRTQANANGAFGGPDNTALFELATADVGRVFIHIADAAGNVSTEANSALATQVRDVQWVATSNGKVAGDPLSNPHRVFSTPFLAPFFAQGGVTEMDGLDRQQPQTAGGATWWQMGSSPASPSGRTRAGMTFDPVTGKTFIAGGTRPVGYDASVSCGNDSSYTTPDFFERGFERHWQRPVESTYSDTPFLGATHLVFDATRKVLMKLAGSKQQRWQNNEWRTECTNQTCGDGMTFWDLAAVVFDPVLHRVVSFSTDNTTFLWDGNVWAPTCNNSLCADSKPTGTATAVAFSDALNETVLFGLGADGQQTWSFNGERWQELCTEEPCLSSRPPARDGSRMTFDRVRQELVLFGGNATSSQCNAGWIMHAPPEFPPNPAFGDTWVFDGMQWHQRSPSTNPGPRYNHAMTYDSVRQRVVMFGGTFCNCHGYGEHPAVYSDTWEWDGENWLAQTSGQTPAGFSVTEAPAASSSHNMATDPVSDLVLMRGGDLGADLWSFKGDRWFRRTSAGYSSRKRVPMASPTPVDALIPQGLVLFTTSDSSGMAPGDPFTFIYDGSSWQPACGNDPCVNNAPSPRYLHGMATDGTNLIAFGGTQWVPVGSGGGPPAGGVYSGTQNDTLRLDATGWTALCTSSPCSDNKPSSRAGHAMEFTGTPGEVLLFGGANSMTGGFADSWLWSTNHWEPQTPTTSPPGRVGHTLVRNPQNNRVILYGGTDDPGSQYTSPGPGEYVPDATSHAIPIAYTTVWEWQAGQWQPVQSISPRPDHPAPGPRYYHGAAWHFERNGMLVYGGAEPPAHFLFGAGTGGSNTTWLWDPEPMGTPAHLLAIHLKAAGADALLHIQALDARWVGSAFSSSPDGNPLATAAFRVWDGTSWQTLQTHSCGDGCALTSSTQNQRALQRVLHGVEAWVAVTPTGTNGDTSERARLTTDDLEVSLWYRLP